MGIGVIKPVSGYEGLYSVSDYGEVFSHITNKWLRPNISKAGYKTVELFREGDSKRVLIHRLVADAFIDNPHEFPYVNHKDENKLNNSANNLEWCTAKYNQNYGTCKERRRESLSSYWSSEKHKKDKERIGKSTQLLLGKKVVQMTEAGHVINEYISVNEAGRQTGIRHISEACNGKRKTAGGYIWTFKGGVDLSVSQY